MALQHVAVLLRWRVPTVVQVRIFEVLIGGSIDPAEYCQRLFVLRQCWLEAALRDFLVAFEFETVTDEHLKGEVLKPQLLILLSVV